ncbi:predicted protein [Arabidopsis lyrata subsp. lyrata]|uniref:Predicted protein n=2 Tax=Arabidopsis lyrata subsp. lyrata TaxID=81972 RepID=D7LQ78_ARALL|nr:predicted protein [Arabidopsis lyrata subsp. lyrata]
MGSESDVNEINQVVEPVDCIGSAFNCKNKMMCPSCRKVEKGEWKYAAHPDHPTFNLEHVLNDHLPISWENGPILALPASSAWRGRHITSVKLLSDIGFKTKVCLDDALEILEAWVHCGDSFKSSISQITRFYKYLWNEMADSKQKITEKLRTLPSVFVPHKIGSRQNDLITGIFLSLDDVYWNDSAGVLDEIKEISSKISSVVESLHRKTLCNIYPGLRDFFVNGCGVPETPSFQEYLKILGQFAHYVSPSCAAKAVFKIFLKWSDDLNSGKSSEDVVHFKERLSELEYTVLPTENDKWVSLHDDEKLKKRFKKKDNRRDTMKRFKKKRYAFLKLHSQKQENTRTMHNFHTLKANSKKTQQIRIHCITKKHINIDDPLPIPLKNNIQHIRLIF